MEGLLEFEYDLANSHHDFHCCCTLLTHQYMLCIFAIVDCTHVGSATASFEDLATLHRTKLQLYASFGHGNSFHERELHKTNIVAVRIVNKSRVMTILNTVPSCFCVFLLLRWITK